MKKYRRLAICTAIVVAVAFFTGCLQTPAPGAGAGDEPAPMSAVDTSSAERVLRFASVSSISEFGTTPNGEAFLEFKRIIEEGSNGKYAVEMFLDGTLGQSSEEVIGGAQNGAFEFFTLSVGSWGGYTKAFAPLNTPYLFETEEEVYAFLDGPFADTMREKVLEDTGIKYLSFVPVGFRMMTSGKAPILSPDDMRGLKLRTMSDPYQIAAMEALGAVPTPVSYSELFTALQQGLVEAQENQYISILSTKVYEVQKYLTETRHNFTITSIAMSQKTYDEFPDDLKALVDEAAAAAELIARNYVREKEEDAKAIISEYLEITELSKQDYDVFKEQAITSWDTIRNDVGDEYFDAYVAEVDAIRAGNG